MAFHHPRPGSASGSVSSSSSGFHLLNSAFGDTTYTKVFVGGLAWETKSETLGRYFERFGDILEAVVITDKNTGKSKGYGFVTFCDPESASKACADPSPVIDGRRVNCNLASLGRSRPVPPHARPRPASPFFGCVPVLHGTHMGGSAPQQLVQFSYPYGYTTYGPEYIYSQNAYNSYAGQQYVQVYGVPRAVNAAVYPFGQLGQPIPGVHGYTTIHGYTIPGHHFLQTGGPNVDGIATTPRPAIQAPFPAGVAAPIPAQPHFIVPARVPQFAYGSGSNKTAG